MHLGFGDNFQVIENIGITGDTLFDYELSLSISVMDIMSFRFLLSFR